MKKNIRKRAAIIIASTMMACILIACGNNGHDRQPETENILNSMFGEALATTATTDPLQADISKTTPESTPESSVVPATTPTTIPTEAPTATPTTTPAQTPAPTERPIQTPEATVKPAQTPEATAKPAQAPTATPQENVPADEQQTEAPAAQTEAPAPPQSSQAAPVHTHSWTETGRSESTDCFAGVTTTSISFSCSCGEIKTDTETAASVCDWQWTGKWEYDYSGCIKFRATYHTCVNHGTTTNELPGFEHVDEHDYNRIRHEPSCDQKGEVVVICNKCGYHFPSMNEIITTDQYPDGGGNGHQFVETSRRDLTEDEARWYGEDKANVTYTCSVCGFSYNDMISK